MLLLSLVWLALFQRVNLTDGIDGLASISVTISLVAYAVIATVQHRLDILIVILSMIGGLLAFFIFNHKPAKIFVWGCRKFGSWWYVSSNFDSTSPRMDTFIIGIVYVFETTSVMMQGFLFQIDWRQTDFRMTPVHLHLLN